VAVFIKIIKNQLLSETFTLSYITSMNLGATPQLECWNNGKMEYWVMGKW